MTIPGAKTYRRLPALPSRRKRVLKSKTANYAEQLALAEKKITKLEAKIKNPRTKAERRPRID